MHKEYFADSYEYVKRVLLRAIAEPDEWIVHPMLFRSKDEGPKGGGLCICQYAAFLGLPCSAVLPGNTRTRQQMIEDVAHCCDRYLFLDPDKGIVEGDGDTKCITVCQLTKIIKARDGKIVLVFDHAFPDGGKAQNKVKSKLDLLCKQNLFGAAVIVREHRCVCFFWLSTKQEEVEKVTQKLKDNLPVPPSRLVTFS